MIQEEEDKLLFPSFAFPDFPEPASGEKKARRRRRKARGGEGGGEEQAKKRRLSDEQARFLEMSFKKERKLETPRKVQLATELGLDAKQVAVWFQNRRARHKSKLMEEEFSRLRTAHDSVVREKFHLETEVLKLKERLAEVEEERRKLQATTAAGVSSGGAGGGGSPCSSFSTVTCHPLVSQFGVEEEADFTYISEYAYNNYMMDLTGAGYYGVYDQLGQLD